MNIVKGVADLIRRTSGGQSGDFGSGLPSERFNPTSLAIRFSDVGNEAILNTLWERYENAFDKAEKKKLFTIFLKQFLVVYRNWEPVNLGQSPEDAFNSSAMGSPQQFGQVVVGCSAGHPAEIIHVLVEEVSQITSMLMETIQSTSEQSGSSANTLTYEGFNVLDALAVTVRSMHNCRVFGFYGGVQKLTALMKAAVVQLKTLSSSLSADESLPNSLVEKSSILQKILVYVVLILCSYIDLQSGLFAKTPFDSSSWDMFVPRRSRACNEPSTREQVSPSEKMVLWFQKAIVSVMEAGGLNWLVDLLRVLRRLSMKEQWTDLSLQYLTLRTLQLSLADNTRGQNHFRSIGGLEVLLDGLGIPPSNAWKVENHSFGKMVRIENPLLAVSWLHVLSLEVLKQAVFGNLSNLQFLSENGRVHKFANSFCSLAFLLQEYVRQSNKYFPVGDDLDMLASDRKNMDVIVGDETQSFTACGFDSQTWNDYVVNLNMVFCSFLLPSEGAKLQKVQTSMTRSNLLVLSAYMELSLKWFLRVLLTVFPCIKACSNQNELPSHLRVFVHILQHSVLSTFRKVLVSFPTLLDVFRGEGVWDFVFSENIFYFGPVSSEFLGANCSNSEILVSRSEEFSKFTCMEGGGSIEIDVLQVEAISLMEFAATLSGNLHNLAECSVLLEALEQSVFNPETVCVLAKSLLHVLQLSPEKSISSFKTLNTLPRVLKVASILAQETRRPGNTTPSSETVSREGSPPQSFDMSNSIFSVQNLHKSVEMTMEIFAQFFSSTDDEKSCILCNSSCIDCLFDLFWEETLRSRILSYILELMKITPSDEEALKAKVYLCSKYMETFTHMKEREKNFAELSIDLLVGMRNLLSMDQMQYQTLFRNGECFLHLVSLLNGNLNSVNGEKLVLNVLQTLTCLLSGNDASKVAFRALVGMGYQTLQSLFLDLFECWPSEAILNALLDMLVDGKFDLKVNPIIKNEDVIYLYLRVLQKSSESWRHNGLNIFLQLLKDSISNRDSCVRAGMLNFLLDWFSQEDDITVILKIAQLIQVTGGHSISGKDIRKIFALLRSEKVGARQQYSSLLLTSMLSMLNEKGPVAFFDCNGIDSGVRIKTPLQWPLNKGFSFTCWLRVETFPKIGTMGLFSFLTESGRGCFAVFGKRQLIYQSVNQKQQRVIMQVNLVPKKWHFLCLTHVIGRAFSGGSQLRCYVDGVLVTSEKCRYAKVNEVLNNCCVGAKINFPLCEEENATFSIKESSAFFGQMGPVYLFNDVITPEQVQGVFSLGPSYMFSFLDNEVAVSRDGPLPGGVLDTKDGLASKIIFGFNAQASKGRTLFNVSPLLEHVLDDNSFEANVLVGTQLCSRRLLQQIIYCVGGVSVFFPLITQCDFYETKESERVEKTFLTPFTKECFTAEVIEIIASVLDENLANQQQMLLLSGFSILGFLLQSVPPEQLNMETLSALKHLFNVVANSGGLSDVLVEDAVSHIFLNPHIWGYTVYKVQRELYMFLIQKLDHDPRLLENFCRLPRVLDIIRQFYSDSCKGCYMIGGKSVLHPMESQEIGERPTKEEVHKIRLLLLSLGEMSLRQHISVADVKALVAFFETSLDMACIEDVLHMVIRAVSEKTLLASFLEQVNLIGGCHIFINLLQRDFEPIRLLGFLFLGRLLVGLPSEKKGLKFFNISVGRSKSLQEGSKKINSRMQPIFSLISDRLFGFPQTDNLSATLFDVLLGGASPKQVLQKYNPLDRQRSDRNNSQFFLPQMLTLIFRYLSSCENAIARIKIIKDLLDLLDSNAYNVEALMEHGWNGWLLASVRLDILKNYKFGSGVSDNVLSEEMFVRSLYCSVLSHYLLSVKGGWHYLEETVNFLLIHCEHGGISYNFFIRDMFEDIIQKLIDLSMEENIFLVQPCRDNVLYLLKLVDEMLVSEIDHKIPFPTTSSGFLPDFLDSENHKDFVSALSEALQGETSENVSSPWMQKEVDMTQKRKSDDRWWCLYDMVWIVISEMNGKGTSKVLPGSSSTPSFSQRARTLVESLNIPAAEMAAVVVSGGISNALIGKPNKTVDKAMLLRGEKCPRIVFRLMVFYLCESSLQRVSQFMQQVVPLLPHLLTADDEQSKSRLHLLIWSLLAVRSQYGASDDGARFHVISQLIRETVNSAKFVLATSIIGRDDTSDFGSNPKEPSTIHNLIQNEQVIAAIVEEMKYLKSATTDRARQVCELHLRMDENAASDASLKKAFEDEIQSNLNSILAFDDRRRVSFHLAYDEEEQIIFEKWIHTIRALIDERGPWSANPFPNKLVSHWKLDKTEDAWRRRQKLRRNYHFDEKLCHPPCTMQNSESLFSVGDGKTGSGSHIPEHMKRFLLKGSHKITDEGTSEMSECDTESIMLKASTCEDTVDSQSSEIAKESSDHKEIVQEKRKDYSYSSTESENSEVLLSVPCVLVTPKRKLAGHLAVMKNILHFFGEFLLEGTGGSAVFKVFDSSGNVDQNKFHQLVEVEKKKLIKLPISSDPESVSGSIMNCIETVQGNVFQKQYKNIKRHRRWSLYKIKAVHWTRYLLRYTAIEIFFSDSVAPVFINFPSQKIAKDVGSLVVATRNELMFPKGQKDRNGTISFVDRRVALEMAETARESWRRRDITNFEYLMILNTLAGRSYNDLTQYPIFPWVLADYSSESLDFNKSSTFRDLSKPVGALDSNRFEVFEERFRNFCDPDIPSFYYGSHYSSMGIVLFYLLRLEPFTSLHRCLQGGKFDHADRLFQSIDGTYRNCLSNTSDVKELIPEFYYMPEFLVNSNSYHFGVRQDGEPLGDVLLPPWAKGSPEGFISKNREALESEYVSSNLHHWIDLVFGYKQRGKPAVEAGNVFYYLTYEGAVDLDTMDDELQRSAIEDQIANFGQTPMQIFRKKHPRRGLPVPIAHPLQYAPGSITLTSIVANTSNVPSTILYVHVFDSSMVLVSQGLTMSVKIWLTTQLHSGGNFTFSGSQDAYFGIGSDILSSRKIGSPVGDNLELRAQCFSTLQTPSDNFLISCGTWENNFQLISLSDGRKVQSIRQHKDIVSCVAVTSDGSILATGSYDTTVMVWEVIRVRSHEKRSRSSHSEVSRRDSVVAETPFHILCGHDDVITCLHVSVELDIVISGSKDGTCIFHTLREGRYVRSLQHPSGCSLTKLVVSRHGQIVLYADGDLSLHLYSINGKHIASSDSNGRLNCLELSCCGEFLVCAGDQGQIVVRSMNSLEIVRRYTGTGKIISSLTVTPEECIIAGTKEGSLLLYSIENPHLGKSSLPRNMRF